MRVIGVGASPRLESSGRRRPLSKFTFPQARYQARERKPRIDANIREFCNHSGAEEEFLGTLRVGEHILQDSVDTFPPLFRRRYDAPDLCEHV